MDIKAYISTGILEQYALGDVSEQERREVECLSKIYPEIKTALQEAERDLQSLDEAGAIKAPIGLKSTIMAELSKHDQLPADAVSASASAATGKAKVLTQRNSTTWPVVWAAAASLALVLAFWQYVERGNAETELAVAKEEKGELLANNEYLRGEVEFLTDDVEESFDPSVQKIVLAPTKSEEKSGVTVMWQQESGKVKINLAALPVLPLDKQYQLWVLHDGVPSDMGVLPVDFQEIYLADSQTSEGDAFAITIEQVGGNENPTMDQLVYLGEV